MNKELNANEILYWKTAQLYLWHYCLVYKWSCQEWFVVHDVLHRCFHIRPTTSFDDFYLFVKAIFLLVYHVFHASVRFKGEDIGIVGFNKEEELIQYQFQILNHLDYHVYRSNAFTNASCVYELYDTFDVFFENTNKKKKRLFW